jgi:hypothetical protein
VIQYESDLVVFQIQKAILTREQRGSETAHGAPELTAVYLRGSGKVPAPVSGTKTVGIVDRQLPTHQPEHEHQSMTAARPRRWKQAKSALFPTGTTSTLLVRQCVMVDRHAL